MAKDKQDWICLPEVRAECFARCDGKFGPDRTACKEANQAALRERARKEAAAYGVGDAVRD